MMCVLQRVRYSCVKVANKQIAQIGKGAVVLIGIHRDDDLKDCMWVAKKICGLRVYDDENAVMNLDIKQVNGEILAVSQFTLLGDVMHGKRPGYSNAMPPDEAIVLFDSTVNLIAEQGVKVKKGVFGADMELNIVNDGPVTIIMDSKK